MRMTRVDPFRVCGLQVSQAGRQLMPIGCQQALQRRLGKPADQVAGEGGTVFKHHAGMARCMPWRVKK